MMRAALIILLFSFASCSKKKEVVSLKYTQEEFMKLASEASLSNEKGDGIKFSDYSPGVNTLESKALMFNRLVFFAIEFETEEQAKNEALRLNQYYSRNWLFDRVEGEPVLEDFVIEKFKAINPKRTIQRVPKKHEDTHGETPGETHEAAKETTHH